MNSVTIHVSAIDLECGVAGSCQSCPVARAMSITPKRPIVMRETKWRFMDHRERDYEPLPAEAKWFIQHFRQ